MQTKCEYVTINGKCAKKTRKKKRPNSGEVVAGAGRGGEELAGKTAREKSMTRKKFFTETMLKT